MSTTSKLTTFAILLLLSASSLSAQGRKIPNTTRGDLPSFLEPEGNLETTCGENVWLLADASNLLECSPVSWAATGPCGGANGGALTINGSSEVVCSDDDAGSNERTSCISLDPAHPTTDWLFLRAERALTVTGIDCLVDSATSVVLTLRECGPDGGSCGATEAAITCGTTNTTEAGAIDDPAVDAGDWLRVLRGTVTGSPTQAILCVTYEVIQ